MLLLFLVAEAWDIPYLADPAPMRGMTGTVTALTGVTLLVVDIVLPVPSSVVMITHGALFGFALGMGLSLLGSLGSFSVGFALGRRGTALVVRGIAEEDRRRAERFLRRWGVLGIILSRPVPLLAETVAFLAGASPLSWRVAFGAAALGYLPIAAIFAVAGSVATDFAHGVVVFLAVVVLALVSTVVVVRRRSAIVHAGQPPSGRPPGGGE